jgi:hypothetical protein
MRVQGNEIRRPGAIHNTGSLTTVGARKCIYLSGKRSSTGPTKLPVREDTSKVCRQGNEDSRESGEKGEAPPPLVFRAEASQEPPVEDGYRLARV